MSNSQGIYFLLCLLPLFHTSVLLQLHPWYTSGWSGVNIYSFHNGNMCYLHGVAAFAHLP